MKRSGIRDNQSYKMLNEVKRIRIEQCALFLGIYMAIQLQ